MTIQKMQIQVWGDITCNFCYTAQRKFEDALSRFDHKEKIDIVWKSFELAPGFKTNPNQYLPEFLAALKGIDINQALAMTDQAAEAAKPSGLEFNFRKTIPANSFNAHRLVHLAKNHQLQDEVKERLFSAYFTEGKNIDNLEVLIETGTAAGLDPKLVRTVLESSKYTAEVERDLAQAKQTGITSVPHYNFNNVTAVSGAQDSEVFLDALKKSFAAWQKETAESASDGLSCEVGKECI